MSPMKKLQIQVSVLLGGGLFGGALLAGLLEERGSWVLVGPGVVVLCLLVLAAWTRRQPELAGALPTNAVQMAVAVAAMSLVGAWLAPSTVLSMLGVVAACSATWLLPRPGGPPPLACKLDVWRRGGRHAA